MVTAGAQSQQHGQGRCTLADLEPESLWGAQAARCWWWHMRTHSTASSSKGTVVA